MVVGVVANFVIHGSLCGSWCGNNNNNNNDFISIALFHVKHAQLR